MFLDNFNPFVFFVVQCFKCSLMTPWSVQSRSATPQTRHGTPGFHITRIPSILCYGRFHELICIACFKFGICRNSFLPFLRSSMVMSLEGSVRPKRKSAGV